MRPSRRSTPVPASAQQPFEIGKKTKMGASGVVVGAIVAGPIGALLGGVLGTAFAAAANVKPKKKAGKSTKAKASSGPLAPPTNAAHHVPKQSGSKKGGRKRSRHSTRPPGKG